MAPKKRPASASAPAATLSSRVLKVRGPGVKHWESEFRLEAVGLPGFRGLYRVNMDYMGYTGLL